MPNKAEQLIELRGLLASTKRSSMSDMMDKLNERWDLIEFTDLTRVEIDDLKAIYDIHGTFGHAR